MAVTVQNLRDLAPEFRDTLAYPDPEIQAAIDTAITQVSPDAWGTDTDLGVKYFAAHLLAVAHPEASQAQKIRAWEDQGDVDIGSLGVTRWGRVFLQLRAGQLGVRMPVVMNGGF